MNNKPTFGPVNHPNTTPNKDGFITPGSPIQFPGDSTVTAVGQTLPGFKWAYEFDQKKPGSSYVKMVNYCDDLSKRLQTGSSFQSREVWNHNFTSEKNEYLSLDCECA